MLYSDNWNRSPHSNLPHLRGSLEDPQQEIRKEKKFLDAFLCEKERGDKLTDIIPGVGASPHSGTLQNFQSVSGSVV